MPPLTTLSGQPHPAREAMRNPPKGRDYGGRPPVGAMSTQGSGFKRDTAQLQATVPTSQAHDSSKEGSTFKRPYYDEDQHVA